MMNAGLPCNLARGFMAQNQVIHSINVFHYTIFLTSTTSWLPSSDTGVSQFLQ